LLANHKIKHVEHVNLDAQDALLRQTNHDIQIPLDFMLILMLLMLSVRCVSKILILLMITKKKDVNIVLISEKIVKLLKQLMLIVLVL